LVVLSFSADPKLPLIWRGVALGPDEVMIHAPGEHLHQRTDGPSRWGMIALSPSALSAFCKTETGRSLPVPEVSRIIKPPLRDWKCLLRVHRQAARLAETRPTIIGHPEVVRAMEYELAGLLVRCLTEGKTLPDPETTLRAIPVMRRFESMLAKPSHQLFSSAEFSAALNVSPRALQKYCLAFLGVGPRRYAQLRQLTHARTAICHADPRTARIAELARLAGFARPGHFAELYKAAYGETPIATLRRAGSA
jgi:AraC-like DNA-binding protein